MRDNLTKVILGKDDVVEQVILGLVSGESILIEDVPGVGKTTLAKAVASSVQLEFQRVQCTPDLLPADIFGFPFSTLRTAVLHLDPDPYSATSCWSMK